MRLTVKQLKRVIREALEDINTLEPGDLVDVMLDNAYGPYRKIRIVRVVDDVSKEVGVIPEPTPEYPEGFQGLGFVGRVEDPDNGDYEVGDEIVFHKSDVIPGSKAKYYFHDDDDPFSGSIRKDVGKEIHRNTLRKGDFTEDDPSGFGWTY